MKESRYKGLVQEGKVYEKFMGFNFFGLGEYIVLSGRVVQPDQPPAGADQVDNDTHTKAWIANVTQHAPGARLPFQKVYRAHAFQSCYEKGEAVNESRFSKLVIETYKDQGIKLRRLRIGNRASFSDLKWKEGFQPLIGVYDSDRRRLMGVR